MNSADAANLWAEPAVQYSAVGEAATFPTDILYYLKACRAEATQQGTWVEQLGVIEPLESQRGQ